MPDEQRTLRVDLGLEDAKETLQSISSTVSNNLRTIGQVAAFGGLAYGGYRGLTTEQGQDFAHGAGSLAMNASSQLRDAAGMAPIGATVSNRYMFENARQGFAGSPSGMDYGVNVRPGSAAHYGARDAAQRVISGGVSALGATGMGIFGMQAIRGALNATGVMDGAAALSTAAGRGIGGTLFGAPFNLAGSAAQNFLPNSIGQPLGNALGFVGQGASTVGSGVGGIAGGMVPHFALGMAVNRAIRTVTDQMANQIGIEGEIDNAGYMFTPGDLYTNEATRRGFGQRELGGLAASAREDLVGERFLRQDDFSEIFGSAIQNDLMFDIRGAEEFEQRFTDMVDNIRDVTRIFETSLEEAGQLIGEMQRSGVYGTSEQVGQLVQADAIGRITGRTGGEVVGMRAQGAEQGSQMGFNRLIGGELSEFGLLGIEGALQGMTANEQQGFQETMQDAFGGQEGAADFFGQAMLSGSINQRSRFPITRALHGMVDFETGTFDEDILGQYMEGEVGMSGLIERATRMASIDPSYMIQMNERPQELVSQMSGPQLMSFMQAFVGEMDEDWMGGIFGEEDIISNITGVQDPRHLEMLTTTLMDGHGTMDMEFVQEDAAFQLARERAIEDRMPRGRLETVRHGFERLGHTIGSPFIGMYRRGMEDVEDFYHEQILGIDRRRIFDHDAIDMDFAPGRGGLETADRMTEQDLAERFGEIGLDGLVHTSGGFRGAAETVIGLGMDPEEVYGMAFDDSYRAQVNEVVRGRIDRSNLDWTREQERMFDEFESAWGDQRPRSQIRNIEEAFGMIEEAGRSADDGVYRQALSRELEIFGYGAIDQGYIPAEGLGGLTPERYYEEEILGRITDETTSADMVDIFLGDEYMRDYMQDIERGQFSTIASMYPEIGRSITSWQDLSEEQRESMQEMGFSEEDFTRGVGRSREEIATELFGEDAGRVLNALMAGDVDDFEDLDREIVRLLSDLVDEDIDDLKQILEDNTSTFERLMLEDVMDEEQLQLVDIITEQGSTITSTDQLIEEFGRDGLESMGIDVEELRRGELASRLDRSLIGQVMTGEISDIYSIQQHEDYEELEELLEARGLSLDDIRGGTPGPGRLVNVGEAFVDKDAFVQLSTEANLGEEQIEGIVDMSERIYRDEFGSWQEIQDHYTDQDGNLLPEYYGLVDFLGVDEDEMLDEAAYLEWVQEVAFGGDFELISRVMGSGARNLNELDEALGDEFDLSDLGIDVGFADRFIETRLDNEEYQIFESIRDSRSPSELAEGLSDSQLETLGVSREDLRRRYDTEGFRGRLYGNLFDEDGRMIEAITDADPMEIDELAEITERFGVEIDRSAYEGMGVEGQTTDAFLIDFMMDSLDFEGIDENIVERIRSEEIHDWASLTEVIDEDRLGELGITEEHLTGEDIESFEGRAMSLLREGLTENFHRLGGDDYDLGVGPSGGDDYYRNLMREVQDRRPMSQEEALIKLTENLDSLPELLEQFDGTLIDSLIDTLDNNHAVLDEIKERL